MKRELNIAIQTALAYVVLEADGEILCVTQKKCVYAPKMGNRSVLCSQPRRLSSYQLSMVRDARTLLRNLLLYQCSDFVKNAKSGPDYVWTESDRRANVCVVERVPPHLPIAVQRATTVQMYVVPR